MHFNIYNKSQFENKFRLLKVGNNYNKFLSNNYSYKKYKKYLDSTTRPL